MIIESFERSANIHARVLILGSMPGVASLREQQYYAHPRNCFWPIMGALFDAGRELPYERRLARLRTCGIALWDVAHRCKRPGSLDADIKRDSVEPNDFAALFAASPGVHSVFFNGKTAAALYAKRVLPALPVACDVLDYCTLPSTSPANAMLTQAQKLARWQLVRQALAR